MERKALITIAVTQQPENEQPETMQIMTEGILKDNGYEVSVSYEESDMIGTEGVTTTICVNRGQVMLKRTGKIDSVMTFREGEKTESLYSLEFGALLLGIHTKRVSSDLDMLGGNIYLQYGVELEKQYLGLNSYNIQVKPIES